jgi:hypothetical protein
MSMCAFDEEVRQSGNSQSAEFTMTQSTSPPTIQQHGRITHRTRGRRDRPIVRLMSPSDLGEIAKPFVFLDLFERFVGIAARLLVVSMFPLALAICLDVSVVSRLIFQDRFASGLIAAGLLALFSALWVLLPRRYKS